MEIQVYKFVNDGLLLIKLPKKYTPRIKNEIVNKRIDLRKEFQM